MEREIAGVLFTCNIDIPEEEAMAYIELTENELDKQGKTLTALEVTIDSDYADRNAKFSSVPFERILVSPAIWLVPPNGSTMRSA